MKIKSRNVLRKNDEKAFLTEIIKIFGDIPILKGKKLEYVETDKGDFIFVEGKPIFFKIEGTFFPTVRGALAMNPVNRRVMVDSGAVKFIVNGADIMGPGIVEADPMIQEGDLVIVVEEAHGKALAIGRALMSGKDMIGRKGKAIKSIHFVGDEIWES